MDGRVGKHSAKYDAASQDLQAVHVDARVSSSLTQTLIQQQYLSKWDGRLPQYTFGGGNAVPFVQLPASGGGAGDGTRR
jgi:hypothetical protein